MNKPQPIDVAMLHKVTGGTPTGGLAQLRDKGDREPIVRTGGSR